MNSAQKETLLDYLKEFLADPVIDRDSNQSFQEFHGRRISAIRELNSLISDFLSEKINLREFKERHDLKCREFPFWGFGGTSGQMQLNQLVKNVSGNDKESVFRKAVVVPKTKKEAAEKIDSFGAYILEKRAARAVEINPLSIPRVASVAYVLSYFWEIQNKSLWPVSYNSSKRALGEIGLVPNKRETAGQNYIWYVELINEIADLYQTSVSFPLQNPLWVVEHALFRHFLKSSSSRLPATGETQSEAKLKITVQPQKSFIQTTNEWLPPIISDLCELALNKETEWSSRNGGTKPEKAFESKIRIAFTLLGYEATELGQGTGRQPDGFAISQTTDDGHYAIIYDAKAREKKFSVGTSDREIYEYIKTKSDELKKQRGIMRSYFLIVSSQFDEDQKNINLIRDVFRRTRIPVVMITASDLLYLIEQKLANAELNHADLEHLFLETGILSREKIIRSLDI